ncbi:phenylalanine--tRNA ligase beta subunit-related protein [Oscillospiraceae bacterium PP1C4]
MFTIDNQMKEALPGIKIGILMMKNTSFCSLDELEIHNSFREIQHKYGDMDRKELKVLYPIQSYMSYYKKFGYSYPVLAQLESVLKGKKTLHAESGVLQAMFLSELESMLLTAGHDLSKLQMPLQLKLAAGNETYQSISEKEVNTVGNDLMICDGTGVISSVLRGPDFKSRITESTVDVLFTIYAPLGIETEYIETSLRSLEERIKAFSRSSQTEVMQVF